MTLPSNDNFNVYVLKCLADEKEHSRKDLYEEVATIADLTEEQRSELLPEGYPQYHYAIGLSIAHLRIGGFIDSPKESILVISKKGLEALRSGVRNRYLERIDEVLSLQDRSTPSEDETSDIESNIDTTSPDEMMDQALEQMNNALISDILTEISNQDPFFFEKLVVDVIQAIYGGEFKENSEVSSKSNDGGIYGIVKQDRLGFNSIYIRAKRCTGSIDRPEIWNFTGAMDGAHATNGAFITSSTFTDGAKRIVERLNNKHIVLIDGRELATLMIEYGIGIRTKKTVEIKKIDYDYFHPD